MGRLQKILPIEVLDALKSNGQITRQQIADELKCCPQTVTLKVKQLIKDGENVGFNQNGLFLLKKGDIRTKEDAELAMGYKNRIFNSLIIWAKRGNNHKQIAIEARKRLGMELTRDERQYLKQQLLLIGRVVDAINLDEDLEE